MPPHTNPALEKRFLLSLALTLAILIAEVLGACILTNVNAIGAKNAPAN